MMMGGAAGPAGSPGGLSLQHLHNEINRIMVDSPRDHLRRTESILSQAKELSPRLSAGIRELEEFLC